MYVLEISFLFSVIITFSRVPSRLGFTSDFVSFSSFEFYYLISEFVWFGSKLIRPIGDCFNPILIHIPCPIEQVGTYFEKGIPYLDRKQWWE